MKKLYILIVLLTASLHGFSQCVPDPTLTKPGIRPEKMPNGIVDSPYSQVITLLVPLDTSVIYNGTPVNVKVDSATVIYLSDFPEGFAYDCNKPTRTWKGGELGCARLFGLPTNANRGHYTIWVKTRTYFKIVGLTGQFDRIDSSEVDFTIDWASGIADVNRTNVLKMHPNPVVNVLSIEVDNYNTPATYKILNMLGQSFNIEPQYSPNTGEVKFDLGSLPSGVYFIKSESAGITGQSRFVKE